MGEVDEQDQAKENEEHGSYKGEVLAPDAEEVFRNQERDDHESEPDDDLRSPEAILKSCPWIFRCSHAEQKEGKEEVEQAQAEIDALYRNVAVALLA